MRDNDLKGNNPLDSLQLVEVHGNPDTHGNANGNPHGHSDSDAHTHGHSHQHADRDADDDPKPHAVRWARHRDPVADTVGQHRPTRDTVGGAHAERPGESQPEPTAHATGPAHPGASPSRPDAAAVARTGSRATFTPTERAAGHHASRGGITPRDGSSAVTVTPVPLLGA